MLLPPSALAYTRMMAEVLNRNVARLEAVQQRSLQPGAVAVEDRALAGVMDPQVVEALVQAMTALDV